MAKWNWPVVSTEELALAIAEELRAQRKQDFTDVSVATTRAGQIYQTVNGKLNLTKLAEAIQKKMKGED